MKNTHTFSDAVDAADGGQYLTFSLNSEEYAVDAGVVCEIIELTPPTRVPHLPPYFKGVINLRGDIIPVIELKEMLGMHAMSRRPRSCVIIIEVAGGTFGLIVDGVSDVLHIPRRELIPSPLSKTEGDRDSLRAMAKIGARLVLVLDVEHLLSRTDTPETETAVTAGAGEMSIAGQRDHREDKNGGML